MQVRNVFLPIGSVFNRRQALKSMALGAVAFAASPILSADTVSPADSQFLSEINLRFKQLIECKSSSQDTYSALYNLCFYIKENYDLFSTWYKTQVNNVINEKNKTKELVLKESLLEEIGRTIINSSTGHLYSMPELSRPKYILGILESYTPIIKNNDLSSDFLSKALNTCYMLGANFDEMMKKKIDGSKELGEKVISLYLSCMKAVEKLPVVSYAIKAYIIRMPVFYYRHYGERMDLIDATVEQLNKFFSKALKPLDTSWFDMVVELASNIDVTNPVLNSNAYILYKIISENKNYFSACIEGKINLLEKFSERINNNDFETNEENRPKDTLHLLKFLSALGYFKQRADAVSSGGCDCEHCQQSRQHESGPPVPPISDALNKQIKEWSDPLVRKLAKPLLDTMDKITISDSFKRNERYVSTTNWDGVISYLNELIPFNSCFGKYAAEKINELLSHDNLSPFTREKYYEALGMTVWNRDITDDSLLSLSSIQKAFGMTVWDQATTDDSLLSLSLIQKGLINEKPVQPLRAIGASLAICFGSLWHTNEKTKLLTTLQKFNSDASNYKDLMSLRNNGANPLSMITNLIKDLMSLRNDGVNPLNMITDLICIVLGDLNTIKALLPGRTFPPPNPDGTRSKETIENAAAYLQLMHNSFLALAYSATEFPFSGTTISNTFPVTYKPMGAYQKATMDFLEKMLIKNLYGYSNMQHWGEKIAAMIEMYNSFYEGHAQKETLIKSKIDYLRGVVFEGRNSLFSRHEESLKEELERKLFWEEADKIEAEWLRRTGRERSRATTKEEIVGLERRNPINKLLGRTEPEHEDFMKKIKGTETYKDGLKKIELDIIDRKREFAYGFLNSAPNLCLRSYRIYLMGDSFENPTEKVKFTGLGLYPYEEEEAFKRLCKSVKT